MNNVYMISIILNKLINYSFPIIKLNNRLQFLLFIFFSQLELLIIFFRIHYILYLLMIVLIYESISDFYVYEINSIGNYILIIIGLIFFNNNFNYISLIIPLILFVFSCYGLLGSGDSEIFLMLCFYFSYEKIIYILMLSSFLAFIYLIFNKKGKLAFAPFITISVLLIYSL